jgi:hypothetical protein
VACPKIVSRWIKRGWLKARNGGSLAKPLYRIQWEDLTTFLECPDYWIAWQPERITDLALREWAQELRVGQPRLLSQREVARRYHVSVDAVGQWIDKGWLKAERYGNRRVPESALEGFVPPCMRDRRTAPVAPGRWPRCGWQRLAADPRFRRRAA